MAYILILCNFRSKGCSWSTTTKELIATSKTIIFNHVAIINLKYLQSQKVAYSAYGQDWMSASAEYKKNIAIIIMRSQKPSTMVVKPIGIVSMNVFSTIVSSSYQFFVFLRQVNNP